MSTKSHEQSAGLTRGRAIASGGISCLDETRSPVAWLVLALVIEQPSHGYEIGQRFEQRFGWFLSLSSSSLYAALDRLRGAGMIEEIVLEPAEEPRRQHRLRRPCRATAAGVRAYRRWVAERMRDDAQRAQILARVASAGVLGVQALLDVVDRYEMECMAEMKALPPADIERLLSEGDCGDEELAESLAIDQQRREIRARLDWASHARRVLEVRARRVAAERGKRGS